MPQGSVLGPLWFVLYTIDLQRLIEQHGLVPQLYVNDTKIYGFCRPGNAKEQTRRITDCVADIASWICSNRQLNEDKADLIWCTSSHWMSQLPTTPCSLGGYDVVPLTLVHDLSVFIDVDLHHAPIRQRIVSLCVAALYVNIVGCLTRLDYCNGMLFGLPAIQIRRLQVVQNTAARLVLVSGDPSTLVMY